MTKILYSLGVIFTLLSFSYNAIAHSGMSHSSEMHSIMHIVMSVCAGLAFIGACVYLSKKMGKQNAHKVSVRINKSINQRVK